MIVEVVCSWCIMHFLLLKVGEVNLHPEKRLGVSILWKILFLFEHSHMVMHSHTQRIVFIVSMCSPSFLRWMRFRFTWWKNRRVSNCNNYSFFSRFPYTWWAFISSIWIFQGRKVINACHESAIQNMMNLWVLAFGKSSSKWVGHCWPERRLII